MYFRWLGRAEKSSFNAISEAKTKNFDEIVKKFGMIKLFASEDKVVCRGSIWKF